MRHAWNEVDDARLAEAVQVLTASEIGKRVRFWSAVAGRMLPDVTATPDACRYRWERLAVQKREAETPAGATPNPSDAKWLEVADKVEAYEKDTLDVLLEYVVGLQDMVSELEGRLAQVQEEQRRLRALWE
jgi:hypothetical protein